MSLFGFKKKEEKKEQALGKKSEAMVLPASKEFGFLLKKPLVTEKALKLEGLRQYIFKVSSDTSKPLIKNDIECLYGVKVESVNIINNKRQTRFVRGRAGYVSGFKKAIIKLKEGHKIEVAPH